MSPFFMLSHEQATAMAHKAADPWYEIYEAAGKKKHLAYCRTKAVVTHQRVLQAAAIRSMK